MRNEARLPRDDGFDEAVESVAAPARPAIVPGHLGIDVAASLWRGTEFGSVVTETIGTGWDALDRELPGKGWPRGSIAELLSPQPSLLEWRLIGPALRRVVADGGHVVVIGPPKQPHLPGLAHEGLDERHLVWIDADTPSSRLWTTEQLVKSNAAGAIVSWIPQARQEQIRRLQICAQGCDGLVFLFRPERAQDEPSAAPLRVHATFGPDWELRVRVFKRRGPIHDGVVTLASVPGGLSCVLTPRLQHPSKLLPQRENVHVVGSLASRREPLRLAVH